MKIDMLSLQDNEEDLTIVEADGKILAIKIDTELAVERQENVINVSDNYKDALLASLYTRVQFL